MEQSKIPTAEDIYEIMLSQGQKCYDELDAFSKDAPAVTDKLLMDIVKDSASTEYGKKYDFSSIKTPADFKAKVPFSTYDDYAPYIERMREKNESGLITHYPIIHYAVTSGSVGAPKYIPVARRTVEIYSGYAATLYFAVAEKYYQKNFNRPAHRGRGIPAMEVMLEKDKNGCTLGCISAATMGTLEKIAPIFYTSPPEVFFPKEPLEQKYLRLRFGLPEENVALLGGTFMTAWADMFAYLETNWQMLCDDIEHGTISPKVQLPVELRESLQKYLKPNARRARDLREIFKNGFDNVARKIWPNVDFLSSIGTAGFKVYTDRVKKYIGDLPITHCAFAASEAFFGAPMEFNSEDYVLLPHGGWYEFIPVDHVDDPNPETLDISQLETGKEYEIVLTNLSGFYRYRIGDIIKVTGFWNKAPKVVFSYRKKQMVSLAGEKTNENMITWVVDEFAKEIGVNVSDYSVYPNNEQSPPHYTFLIEPNQRLKSERVEYFRKIIQQKLSTANPSAGAKIANGALGPVELRFIQQQTYALYRDIQVLHGVSANQIKPVRIINTKQKRDFFYVLTESFRDEDEAAYKVSAIVPIYNCEPYLAKCIESVLAQTLKSFELILVDDGSTDNSPAICDEYAQKDHRIKVIHNRNAGVASARNSGIEASSGEYITFIDSDDWVGPELFERLVAASEKDGTDIATLRSFVLEYEDDKRPAFPLDKPFKHPAGKADRRDIEKEFLETEPLLTTVVCGKIYRSSLFDTLRFVKRPYEDTRIMPFVWGKAETVSVVEYDGYFYLQRAGSAMHKRFTHKDANEFFDSRVEKILYYYNHGFTDASYDHERSLLEQNLLKQMLALGGLSDKEKAYANAEYNKRRDWFFAQEWTVQNGATKLRVLREGYAPFVSVVVPVYNCGEFLAPCLASLSKQTYENAEFIIVDDGSNDGSAMVCDRFAEKDPRFRIIHKVNGGVSAARNDGVDAAKGEYLMFLDGDDYIADETIADLVKSIEKHKSDIATITMANLVVAADSEGSSMNGMMSNRPIELAEGVYPASEISRAYIESEPLLTSVVWGKLFRRELWEGVRYPTHIGFEDTMTLPYVYNKAKTVSCISGDYYFYVQRAGSVMHQWGSSKKLCDFFDSRVFKITEFYNHGYADCGWTLERRLCEFSLGYLWSSIKRKGEDMAEYTKRKAWFDRQKWTVSGGKTTLCLVP